jgi:hypothetical protein
MSQGVRRAEVIERPVAAEKRSRADGRGDAPEDRGEGAAPTSFAHRGEGAAPTRSADPKGQIHRWEARPRADGGGEAPEDRGVGAAPTRSANPKRQIHRCEARPRADGHLRWEARPRADGRGEVPVKDRGGAPLPPGMAMLLVGGPPSGRWAVIVGFRLRLYPTMVRRGEAPEDRGEAPLPPALPAAARTPLPPAVFIAAGASFLPQIGRREAHAEEPGGLAQASVEAGKPQFLGGGMLRRTGSGELHAVVPAQR